jgi:hypothetical protein
MRGGGERYNPLDVLNSATAVNVLGELSIGGTLMRGSQPNSAIRNKLTSYVTLWEKIVLILFFYS